MFSLPLYLFPRQLREFLSMLYSVLESKLPDKFVHIVIFNIYILDDNAPLPFLFIYNKHLMCIDNKCINQKGQLFTTIYEFVRWQDGRLF